MRKGVKPEAKEREVGSQNIDKEARVKEKVETYRDSHSPRRTIIPTPPHEEKRRKELDRERGEKGSREFKGKLEVCFDSHPFRRHCVLTL